MAELPRERWRELSALLDTALDLPGDQRGQWLAALRDQDPRLADQLRGLLDEHEIVSRKQFLERDYGWRPAAQIADGVGTVTTLAGRIFGAYQLVSVIGHGGMGAVWLGERCDGHFVGQAAVKLLDIHRFGRSEARFRHEASILARVAHPNIAHLMDAGVSSDGQPYLVLEFVDGQPIDQYCDERTLDVRSRIALMLHVLDAVAHAHTNRIVHRDIKPSNVLVRTDGHVKLLDFGIAKLVERDDQATMASTLTIEQGGALTPAFAAPEQVSGGRVTPATDIYALGVLLYLLLTGQHPCGEVTSPVDLLKAIVEIDPPPLAAAVVAGSAPEAGAGLAASRATTPARLHKLLKGDLDTIVAKTLKKDPLQRYGSVAELADDLRRYLSAEPIRARRDSVASRTVRLVRRHPGLVTAATVGALVLGGTARFYTMRPVTERNAAAAPAPAAPVPVTSEAGDEIWPSLSPDQTRVAFTWSPPNATGSRIAIKTLGSGAVVPITDGTANDTMPVWSPDAQHLAFLRSFREPTYRSQICLVPVTGGPARVVLDMTGINRPGLAWWKTGNALLFSTRDPVTSTFRLAELNLATLDVRFMTNPPQSRRLTAPGDFLPAVAPDQRTVAFVRETQEGRDVCVLDLVTRHERQLTRDHHRITGLTWAADGRSVIMSALSGGVEGLYRAALTDGASVRVPDTGDWATQPMASAGGVVFSQTHSDSNIYRVELRNQRAAARRASSSRPRARTVARTFRPMDGALRSSRRAPGARTSGWRRPMARIRGD